MSSQDLEVYAAAAATCDGVYTRLRAQVELLREGADNISVIKTLLDMTIPKDAPSCAIAGALQFLANGRDSGALLNGLFKDRRASLLLLMDGTAAAKALMAEDLISIHKTKEGYVVARLTDVLMAREGDLRGSAHGRLDYASSRHQGGHRGGHRGGHVGGHRGSHVGGHIGGSGHDGGHDGGHRGSYVGSHRGGRDGGHRGDHRSGDQHVRSDFPHQRNSRGGRGGGRSGDKVPYQMSPDMVKEIIDTAAKDLRAGAVEEFPLPTRQRATHSYSTALVQPVSAAAGLITAAPVDTSELDAIVESAAPTAPPSVAPPTAAPPTAAPPSTTPVTIRVKKPAARASRAAEPIATPLVAATPLVVPRQNKEWGDDEDDDGKFFEEPLNLGK